MPETTARIESELDVRAYLQDLKYALEHGAKLTFQEERLVDQHRDQRYTNRFTVADLFPDESPVTALKRELQKLTVEEYTMLRFPLRPTCSPTESGEEVDAHEDFE